VTQKRNRARRTWRSIDLHLHTPASSDYQEPKATYLDVLLQAEKRGLDIIAFTDHNTVAGYRKLFDEINQLEMLEGLKRLVDDERARLMEYRRLLDRLLVLPGFEFTATFGFHILAIFPPDKSVREIEHLLLALNIPPEQLDEGAATVGATSDVITAYKMIRDAGGMVIAAHANSSNGVAMRGFSFGGQTKIAYTQDSNLHALEVTDLENRGRRTTSSFFRGTKPEYPRRMHCIQGSDAHRLIGEGGRNKNLGIGDRATEVLIPSISFESLKDLFESHDFARTRPRRQKQEKVFDFVRVALEDGPNIVQDFHENLTVRGGQLYNVLADVCAFANTNGGTLYIGLSADPKKDVNGIAKPNKAQETLEKEIGSRISPQLTCQVDVHETHGKKIIRVLIPQGDDSPYVIDDYKIYVRTETETSLAVRDEIVNLVMRGPGAAEVPIAVAPAVVEAKKPSPAAEPAPAGNQPKTGVEVVSQEERGGKKYYTMCDLRNGNVVKNVTHSSARRLWHYAITAYDKLTANGGEEDLGWQGDLGMVRHQQQGQINRYDLVQRSDGRIRYYFGVTEDGIHGDWKALVGGDEDGE
jgi:hypothetical protein